MYDHLLVPTDGSDHAIRAAGHAAVLSRAFDATVHLLTVVDVDDAAGPFSAGGVDDEYVERLTEQRHDVIAATEPAVESAAEVESTVVTGQPANAILDYVSEHEVDLVCMGTHGRRGLSRYLTGSVAEHVLRKSPVPVVTARATDASVVEEGYDEILVPTDGSDEASAAVPHAIAIAERFDSQLHVVSVVETGAIATGTEVTVPSSLITELKAWATRAVEDVEAVATEAGIETETSVATGVPKRMLLDYVADAEIDLVCVGTHGHTGIDRILLGSTAEALVRRANVPVMTVSTPDA